MNSNSHPESRHYSLVRMKLVRKGNDIAKEQVSKSVAAQAPESPTGLLIEVRCIHDHKAKFIVEYLWVAVVET